MSESAILMVDDEKTVLDSLSSQLHRLFGERHLYEVAESADEAFEVLRDLVHDGVRVVVVVSDWLMPGMKGDEFLADVRRLNPGIGRILLTGQADPAALDRARSEARVHQILFKPWRPEELRAAIERCLGAPEGQP